MKKQFVLDEEDKYWVDKRIKNIEQLAEFIESDIEKQIDKNVLVENLKCYIEEILLSIKGLKKEFIDSEDS